MREVCRRSWRELAGVYRTVLQAQTIDWEKVADVALRVPAGVDLPADVQRSIDVAEALLHAARPLFKYDTNDRLIGFRDAFPPIEGKQPGQLDNHRVMKMIQQLQMERPGFQSAMDASFARWRAKHDPKEAERDRLEALKKFEAIGRPLKPAQTPATPKHSAGPQKGRRERNVTL